MTLLSRQAKAVRGVTKFPDTVCRLLGQFAGSDINGFKAFLPLPPLFQISIDALRPERLIRAQRARERQAKTCISSTRRGAGSVPMVPGRGLGGISGYQEVRPPRV